MIVLGNTHLTFEDFRPAPVRQIVFPCKLVPRVRLDLISWALGLRPHDLVDRGDGLRPQGPRVFANLASILTWQQLSRLTHEGRLP
jgi:hypothetical protein